MYKQPREAHEARVHTRAYRVYGLIHLVPGAGTADLLNAERAYLPVTGALVYTPGFRHPSEARDQGQHRVSRPEEGEDPVVRPGSPYLAKGLPDPVRLGQVLL